MAKILQDYCDEKKHLLKESNNGFLIYFYQGWASQIDIMFLVRCANEYGWHFFIAGDENYACYAKVYEPILPIAA